jgi:type VI protein secretion system component Hcp
MANEPIDVLMTFIQKSGKGVGAESRAVMHPDDQSDMCADFTEGCYFEIESFSFSAELSDEADGTSGSSGTAVRNATHSRDPQKGGAQGTAAMSGSGGKFAKYIIQGSLNYKIEPQEITISRQMDKASPILLDNCLKRIPFTKAVIVKRKVVGVLGNSSGHHRGFLRMEFSEPLITGVTWEDSDTVKETLKFVCRNLTVTYRPQKDTGEPGDKVPMTWNLQRTLAGGGNG